MKIFINANKLLLYFLFVLVEAYFLPLDIIFKAHDILYTPITVVELI